MSLLLLLSRLEELDINIELAEGQLKIDAPRGKLKPGLIKELKDRKQELIGFFQEHVQTQESYASIESVEKREYYPLSSAQKRLYVVHQLDNQGIGYNIPLALELEGRVDKTWLEDTFKRLVQRHESLRTSFEVVEEEPVQRIHENVEFSMEHGAWGLRDFVKPFDLSQAPLLRVGLIKMAEEKHILVLDMHHIITDGLSMGIFVKEFITLYSGDELPVLRIHYKDFALWQNREDVKKAVKGQQDYWLKEFSEEIPVLKLPVDFARPKIQDFEGNRVRVKLGEEESRQLKAFASAGDVTLFMVLLSIYYVLLSKLSGQEDIVVGTPVGGRRHADLSSIIGMFVNTLPLGNYPLGKKTFNTFLQEVKTRTLDTFENQEYPFEELVERLEVKRDTGRNPLYDVVFSLQSVEIHGAGILDNLGMEIPGLRMKPYEFEIKTAKFDMNFTVLESEAEGLLLSVEYCTALFKQETIHRFVDYYRHMIRSILEAPEQQIREIDFIPEEEKHLVLYGFNNTAAEYPRDKAIHQLFEEQVERTPAYMAVIGPESQAQNTERKIISLTYRELHQQSNRLANMLKEKSILVDSIIGIMMERSIEMIIGILGILKAGCAYLPIDPGYPEERINYMLEDSNAKVLLASPETNVKVKEKSFEIIDFFHLSFLSTLISTCQVSPTNLAYIIYTSGSTGKPKGVMIEHYNVVRLMYNDKFPFDFSAHDVWTMFHSYCFDFSVWEMYGALLYGGKLVIIPKMTAVDSREYLRRLKEEQVTVVNQTPSAFYNLMELELREPRKELDIGYVIFGGEALNPARLQGWHVKYPAAKLINMYGITETTVHVTFKKIGAYEIRDTIRNIGKPIPTLSSYIMDRNLKLLPIGVPGELTVGGKGLGRGYLNQPQLTAQKFVINPYKPGERLYKSGDLARWLPDSNIEYLGRIDHQVKIRGYRIELGEIENCILKHREIKEVVVLTREDKDGGKYICAYIVSQRELIVSQLRESLSKELPDYMLPSYFVFIEKIPLTPNGKVDSKALPEPETGIGTDMYVPPRNDIEEKLVRIWSEVLAIEKEKISTSANFFALGGHSLRATVMLAKIQKTLNVELPLAQVFKSPTIKGLSNYIKGLTPSKYISLEPTEKKEYYPLSSAQRRLYILKDIDEQGISYNLPSILMLEGDVNKNRFEGTFKSLIKRHESLRTSFHMIADESVQRIHEVDDVEFEIEYYDASKGCTGEVRKLGSWEAGKIGKQTKNVYIKNFIRPFDFLKAPLLRVGLIKEEEKKCFLMVDMHHIISDGLSMGIFVKEFMELYGSKNLPALRLQYKDYGAWQNKNDGKEYIKEQEIYWLKQFEGEVPVLNIPTDYLRPSVQSFAGRTLHFEINKEETAALKSLAHEQDVTLFMLLFSLYTVFLSKLSGQEDIVLGTAVAGRRHTDLESIIGMFVNTLALRNSPVAEKTFDQFLGEIKENTIKAFENQDYLYEDLVEQVAVERDTGRNPLFDVMFALQNMDTPDVKIPGLKVAPYPYENRISKFDLTLTAVEIEDRLAFTFEYSTNLFKKETIQRFIGFFKKTGSFVLENYEIRISEIEIITEEEKSRILHDFNDTGAKYPRDKTIHQLFAEQVKRTPHRIAVMGPQIQTGAQIRSDGNNTILITYKELDEKSNHLAYFLKAKGVLLDTIVGLMVERSIEMLIGILGILKSGSAYLPINTKNPPARTQYILADSGAGIIIRSSDISSSCLSCPSRLNTAPKAFLNLPTGRHAAYVIYTSGSIGNPKGVAITHANFSPLVHWGYKHLLLGPGHRTIQNLAYYFDWSVWEIFITLTTGACLYPVGEETLLNPELCIKFMQKHAITVLHVTPTQYQYFLHPGWKLETLKYLFIGAEKLTYDLAQRSLNSVLPSCRVFNMYGPTEATIISVVLEIHREEIGKYQRLTSIPIGEPVSNFTLLVVDGYLNLCPITIAGELMIQGEGVAQGYLNNPELTAEKFINYKLQITNRKPPPSHSAHSSYLPIYRTGDLCRWLPEGNVEFLGRMDHQVKIRGFRIELGEIENQLLAHGKIKEAIVLAREDNNDKYLCAYIVTNSNETIPIDYPELREYLSHHLPDYMVPAYFVQLDNIPLTPNGKIDRKLLPEPAPEASERYTAPRNEVEEKLAEIWSDVLGIEKERTSIDANFFELGGHSLKATALTSKIHKELKVKIPLAVLFKKSTIRGLSYCIKEIKETKDEKYQSIKTVEVCDYYPLSSAQKRMYIVYQMGEKGKRTAYHLPRFFILKGNLDEEKFETIFKKLIERHEVLRSSFHWLNDEVIQKINDKVEFKVKYTQLSEKEAQKRIKKFIKPFDLDDAPLLRVELINIEEKKYFVLFDIHHIISDGASIEILIKEFVALYEGKNLAPLSLQYKDYAVWQNKSLKEGKLKNQERYWLKKLEGFAFTQFPLDHFHSYHRVEGKNERRKIDKSIYNEIEKFCNKYNVTKFTFMITIFAIVLANEIEQTDITIALSTSIRDNSDIKHLIGILINLLLIRIKIDDEDTFLNLLTQNKKTVIEALNNQHYPYEMLYHNIREDTQLKKGELFSILFIYFPSEINGDISTDDFEISSLKTQENFPKCDITLYVYESYETITLNLVYNGNIYDDYSIKNLLDDLFYFIQRILENADMTISILTFPNEYDGEFENYPDKVFS